MNHRISLAALALLPALALPAHGATFFPLAPDPTLEPLSVATGPDGCYAQPGLARGALGAPAGGNCHSGAWGAAAPGFFAGDAATDPGQATALFLSAPLAGDLAVGGPARLVVYYTTAHQDGYAIVNQTPTAADLEYAIAEVSPAGAVTTIASGRALRLAWSSYPSIHRGEAVLQIPGHTLASGNRLRLSLSSTMAPGGRLIFGGAPLSSTSLLGAQASYADAGITLGDAGGAAGSGGAAGGAGGGLGPATLLALLLGRLVRMRRGAGPAPLSRACARTPS